MSVKAKNAAVKSRPDFPVAQARRYLEPGPIVLVSSHHEGRDNIMTMGWHMVMEFTPSLVGCVIAPSAHSHRAIRESGECVINIPTVALVDKVVGIGNTSGADIDKFEHFKLTPEPSRVVRAPRIAESHASLECRVHDAGLAERYGFFILEVVRACAAKAPQNPETLHYQGDGRFMVAGKVISRKGMFQPHML
ncbi:flavin reductase family protein [Comamonadaceae bacterium PP-2]